MSQDKSRDDVLFAFAVESERNRATLDRYLNDYPEFADDLIDLSNEIRVTESTERNSVAVIDDAGRESAWASFKASGVARLNPFVHLKGRPFVEFCNSLRLPRSIVTALRDRLVEPNTIPKTLVAALASLTDSTTEAVMRYLDLPPKTSASMEFKSDQKPTDGDRVTFQQLIQNTELTESQHVAITEYVGDGESN